MKLQLILREQLGIYNFRMICYDIVVDLISDL